MGFPFELHQPLVGQLELGAEFGGAGTDEAGLKVQQLSGQDLVPFEDDSE